MEKIMTMIIEKSESLNLELVELLVTSARKEKQITSSVCWQLARKIIKNCASRLLLHLPDKVAKEVYGSLRETISSTSDASKLREDATRKRKFEGPKSSGNILDMDEPCDICGDIGVVEAIITCCECKASREHLYCMSVVRTDVPPFWTCKLCEHKNQQSTGLKEKVVLSFHNKGGVTRSIKSPVRMRTLAELLPQESTRPKGDATPSSKPLACERMPIHLLQKEPATELEPQLQQPLLQKLTGQKAEKAVLPGDDVTPSVKPPMSSTTKRKLTESKMMIARIEAVPPIKVAIVGREVVVAESPEEPETNTGGKNHGDVEAQSSEARKPILTSGLLVSETNSPY